jgi:hypothetical protein
MSTAELLFKEPVKQMELTFALIPRRLLKVSPFQRDKHPKLISGLANSIVDGFLVPLLVVEVDGLYEVIDGQHRLDSLDKQCSGDYDVPCIVAPLPYREMFLSYNIEQADKIGDRATKVYNFYMFKLNQFPNLTEMRLNKSFAYESYIISVAFAVKENNITSASLIESPVKKLDKDFFEYPLTDSVELRRGMAAKIKDLENTVLDVCKQYSVSDFNLKKSIVSKSSGELWGRKRILDASFHDGMDELIAQIKRMDWSWLYGR